MIVERFPFSPPEEAFAPLAGRAGAHLFCGGTTAEESWGGEWAYLLGAPTEEFSFDGEVLRLNGLQAGAAKPFEALEEFVRARARRAPLGSEAFDGLPPPSFQGGIAGFIAYEAARWLEPVLRLPPAALALPEMALWAYDAVACLHTGAQKAYLVARNQRALDQLKDELKSTLSPGAALEAPVSVTAAHNAAAYQEKVAGIKAAIRRGDIFQANLTQQLRARFSPEADFVSALLPAFAGLKEKSSAGHMALIQLEGAAVLSNSPESYFTLAQTEEGLKATARPVKGTRARAVDPAEDRRIAAELIASEKDRAENIMIADLVRNDLSRICLDHSIQEEQICTLHSFGHVHHLVSVISGVLREGKDAVDVLKATFPCGSITGAPKIRAMEIIADTEKTGRGVYCGAIGLIDDGGAAVFSVPIRTAVAEYGARTLSYGTGGGITILSEEAEEYQEILTKAASFFVLTGTTQEDLA